MQPKLPNFVTHYGGHSTGIIRAPSRTVWTAVNNFFSLDWWDTKFIVEKIQEYPPIRLVSIRHKNTSEGYNSDVVEKQINVIEEEGHYEMSYQKMKYDILAEDEIGKKYFINNGQVSSSFKDKDQIFDMPIDQAFLEMEEVMRNLNIITTMRFEDIKGLEADEKFCRFTFFSQISGPQNPKTPKPQNPMMLNN